VVDAAGHPSAGPEGIEMLRDGGTYIEMGQFTDAGSIETSWHRFCVKDINILGSWAFTADDIALGIDLLYRTRERYPYRDLQTRFPFSEDGVQAAIDAANAMRCVKATIVVNPDIVE
jgi:threonine dehydrogenase-like Zn-dependent dehydrogenase